MARVCCCMSLTMASKLIGTFGMSLAILMINVLVSHFFSKKEEHFIIALESWMLFGLNWTLVMRSIKVVETAHTLLTCVLIYSTLTLAANAFLTLGSLLKKPDYLLPWMYVQMMSMIAQTISLAVQLSSNDPEDKSSLYIPACSAYLLLSSYFWMVVSSTRKAYIAEAEAREANAAAHAAVQQSSNCNLPKTPSYLSSNIATVQDCLQALPPPKYEVV